MTRLETRTKESNMYASIRVQKPKMLNESDYVRGLPLIGYSALQDGQPQG